VERCKILLHVVDAAGTEGRDPVEDVRILNEELKKYSDELSKKPQILVANKCDAIFVEEGAEDPVKRLREAFETEDCPVFAVSGVTKEGTKELLGYIRKRLSEMPREVKVYEPEYEYEVDSGAKLPYTVENPEPHVFVVEGPRIEKMLGYTNLDSEKGFSFFQRFLKESGILKDLEKAGIEEGDTVRMYGHSFDYFV